MDYVTCLFVFGLLTEVGEAPHVAKSHHISDAGEDELDTVGPRLPLGRYGHRHQRSFHHPAKVNNTN